jgi:hypothetical protein
VHRWRSHATVAALAALALLLAACGGSAGSDASGEPVDPDGDYELVVAAAARTEEGGSARFDVSMRVDALGVSQEVSISGALALDGSLGSFEMDLGALGVPLGGPVEARLVDGVVYMDVSALGPVGAALGGTRWVSLDLERASEQLGLDPDAVGASDPSQFLDVLESLRGVTTDLEELGREDVRGEPTTHFRVTVDLAAALGEVAPGLRDEVGRVFEQLGTGTVPMDVWVDGDGRLRRLVFEMQVPSVDGADGEAAVAVTMELHDFGVEVDVEAPPPDETTDLFELLGDLSSVGAPSA